MGPPAMYVLVRLVILRGDFLVTIVAEAALVSLDFPDTVRLKRSAFCDLVCILLDSRSV